MKKHTQENSTLRDEPIFESRQHGIKTFLYKLLSYLLKIDNEHVDFSFFEILFITQLIKKIIVESMDAKFIKTIIHYFR